MNKKSVLFIDDEKNLLATIKRQLKIHNYDVHIASTAKQAFDVLKGNNIAVIVSDQRMPNISGAELLAQIKEKYPNATRLIMSGYTDYETLEKAINQGEIYKFVPKPWNESELLTILEGAFSNHHQKVSFTRCSQTLENTREMIVITNTDGIIESVNSSFTILTGYSNNELVGKNIWDDLIHSDSDPQYLESIQQELLLCETWEGKVTVTLKNNKTTKFLLSVSYHTQDSQTYCSFSFLDYSELQQKERWLQNDMYSTETKNHLDFEVFFENCSAIIESLPKNKQALLVGIHIDLTELVQYNQQDEMIICETSKQIIQAITKSSHPKLTGYIQDSILGVLFIDETSHLMNLFKKIKQVFSKPFIINGKYHFLLPTLGGSAYPNDAQSAKTLISDCILSVEYAIANHKNQIIYSEFSHQIKTNPQLLTHEIIDNINLHGFSLSYQPQVAPISHQPCGFDLALKLNQPPYNKGVIDLLFLSKSNDLNVVENIEKQIFQEAMCQIQYWQEQFRQPFLLQLPIAPILLTTDDLYGFFKRLLQELYIQPQTITLEISEKVLVKNLEQAKQQMKKLKTLGLKIGLNDFGTGIDFLPHLSHLPLDSVKIDLSFYQDSFAIARGFKILNQISKLCDAMGIAIYCKGVSDRHLQQFAEDINCQSMQGALFSQPLDTASVKPFLTNMNNP